DSNRRGAQVEPHDAAPDLMLWLLVGHASERHLHEVAMALGIGPLSARTTRVPLDQPGVFHPMSQSVGHDGVVPVNQRGKPVALPEQIPGISFLGVLEYEAQPCDIAFVFDAGDPSAATP